MEVIILLILASLTLAGIFLAIFVWATKSGQFEDTTTPALRMLADDMPVVAVTSADAVNPSLKKRTQSNP